MSDRSNYLDHSPVKNEVNNQTAKFSNSNKHESQLLKLSRDCGNENCGQNSSPFCNSQLDQHIETDVCDLDKKMINLGANT